MRRTSRRGFLRGSAVVAGVGLLPAGVRGEVLSGGSAGAPKLRQFGYGEIEFAPGVWDAQLHATLDVLLGLPEDALLKPFRVRSGKDAPGVKLGGWYDADGYCPGHTLGQWVSAFSRYYAITGDEAVRAKVHRIVVGLGESFDAEGMFFADDNRFPAYTLEKLNCGLIDAAYFAHDPDALRVMAEVNRVAQPHLPEKALSRAEQRQRTKRDATYTYDETYTLPENYFLAYRRTGDARYRELGLKFMHHAFLDPLADGENVLPGLHAYSHLNALNSATQAYLAMGNRRDLKAAVNGFEFIRQQSYATGGWGPREGFVTPGQGELGKSLTATHSSFETPCGAYGHFKVTRTLLEITGEGRYGDSMETVMYNTVLGALPLRADGSAFYYSDYSPAGKKGYHDTKWPCCSGTLAQVAADYRISTYLQDDAGVSVNLYIPSTLRWMAGGRRVELEQRGGYPLDGTVQFVVKAAKPVRFALRLRIPAWAGDGAAVSVNGKAVGPVVGAAGFYTVARTWRAGDRVELVLPLALRLQAVDAETPGTVALLRGPLVLFGLGAAAPVSEAALLAAEPEGAGVWVVKTEAGERRLTTFERIQEQGYSTYHEVAG